MYDPPKPISRRCYDSIQYRYASYRCFSLWWLFSTLPRHVFLLFFYLESRASPWSPITLLRSVWERQREDKRNITRELGGHQRVQKFSIRLSRDGSRTQWGNCIMSTQWMSSSISTSLFFFLTTRAIHARHIWKIVEHFVLFFRISELDSFYYKSLHIPVLNKKFCIKMHT